MPASQETILQALPQVPAERWPPVLDYLSSLQVRTAAGLDPATVARLADTT